VRKRPTPRAKIRKSPQRQPRRKLVPISEEMRHWSAVLEAELASWPTTSKPMFGFQAFFRYGKIFAAIPRTRGFGTASSFMLKFNSMPPTLAELAKDDTRMDAPTRIPGNGWHGFELSSGEDLKDAIWWLSKAYDYAKK
jgi:hypothetical protein